MSHIVTIQAQIKDTTALLAACRRVGLSPPQQGTARLFATEATGQIVQLPGWTYPLVIDTQTGQLHYDNYNGAWGAHSELSRLLQAYAVEKAKLEALRQGHSVVEQQLPSGSIKLLIHVGGGGA